MWLPLNEKPLRIPVITLNGDNMVKTRFKHFNPEEHKIESKIATVKTSHHCKFNINYHIIWIPKYRKHILKDKVKEVLQTLIKGICYDNKLDMLALEIQPEHLHLFIGAKPTHNPASIVKSLKGNTSIQLRRVFPEILMKILLYHNVFIVIIKELLNVDKYFKRIGGEKRHSSHS